ncbi:MAG: hypothetical protein U5N85_20545 [Arcicella sp.]|nr:hypothetical protein [Arcicella sp.]
MSNLDAKCTLGKKAIPVVWKTIQAPKGHFPESDHLLLLKLLEGILKPLPNVRCVMLGDGEYDGSQWIQQLQNMSFEYVLRTAKDTLLMNQDQEIFQPKKLDLGDSSRLYIPDCQLSSQVKTHFVLWHERSFKDPVCLLTNRSGEPSRNRANGYWLLPKTVQNRNVI